MFGVPFVRGHVYADTATKIDDPEGNLDLLEGLDVEGG